MWGVADILAYGPEQMASPQDLSSICDDMASRGSDGAGTWFSEDGAICLGHRRLEIIDPGAQGAQPMALDYCRRLHDDRLVITFNGECFWSRRWAYALACELDLVDSR